MEKYKLHKFFFAAVRVLSVNKRKREKVCMKTNDGERLVWKPEKHVRHLVLNARDLPCHLAFDLALETGSSVGNATSLALLCHFLAFTSIWRVGQRTSVTYWPLWRSQCAHKWAHSGTHKSIQRIFQDFKKFERAARFNGKKSNTDKWLGHGWICTWIVYMDPTFIWLNETSKFKYDNSIVIQISMLIRLEKFKEKRSVWQIHRLNF